MVGLGLPLACGFVFVSGFPGFVLFDMGGFDCIDLLVALLSC